MAFEAEVIPLFIGGASMVCVLELVFGCLMLRHRKQARNRFVAHVVCMAAALFFLIRCIFANWLQTVPGISSISNSVNIGLSGVFWAVSIFLLLSAIHTVAGRDTAEQ